MNALALRLTMLVVLPALGIQAHAAPAPPPFRQIDRVPVKDLIQQVAQHLKDNPKDAHAYFLMGVIHFNAFENKRTHLRVYAGNHQLPSPVMRGDVFREGPGVPLGPGQRRPSQPKDEPLSASDRKLHLREASKHFNQAIELDDKSGRYRMWLADTLMHFVSQAKDSPPISRLDGKGSTITVREKTEIQNHLNQFLSNDERAQNLSRTWLLKHGARAEPIVTANLGKNEKHNSALQNLLADYWKTSAIKHYLAAHDLDWKKDITAYNPAYGEPWDRFTSLRSGRIYLDLTKDVSNATTQQRQQIVNAHFAALRKKIRDYKGPVR